jgi:PAS domain S-box-containing protein
MRVLHPLDPASTYAAVLDALPIAAFMAAPDGTLSYLSHGWERYSNTDAVELLRRGFVSIIHPDDRYAAQKKWKGASDLGLAYRDEYRVRFGDGIYRWVLSQAEPMRDDDGTLLGWFGTLTDIDDLKRTEAALADSEATYRALTGAIPGVTWAASPQGDLTFVGERWISLHGRPREGALGESWLESVYPADRERVLARWAQSLASGEEYDIQFRVRIFDGTYRWFLVRALPVRDAFGTIVRWFGVNVDIDDQRKADERREQFVRLAEASDDFVGIADDDGRVVYVNEAARRLLGIASVEEALDGPYTRFLAPEDLAYMEAEILPAIDRDGRWSGEFWFRNVATGERIPVAYNVFTLRDHAGERVGLATVSRDIRERRRLESGLVTLAETGAAMFASLDFEQTLRNIAQASIRAFATYCIVDTVGEHGEVRNVAAIHQDPALTRVVERAVPKRALLPNHPTTRALRDSRSTFVPHIPRTWVADTGMEASGEDDFRALSPRSLICVPMRTPSTGAVVGAITFVIAGDDTRGGYTQADVPFAEEIAMRAGLAFDHAMAYERERRIAVTLQDASLPQHLPKLPKLRLSADYRPGSNEATIGGDWYDAFLLDDGRVAVTVGDVLGNGLGAAVTMSRVRQAMRAVATLLPEPRAMLDVADRTIRDELADTYATALAGILDPVARTFTFASAGHPGPWLRRAGGGIEEFAAPGTMLGLRTPGEAVTAEITLEAGASLVFFTDGLVEGTHDIDEGYARLRAAMSDPQLLAAHDPAGVLVERILDGSPPHDDIAVLVCGLD